ncbi:MAG: 4-hydroxy-tetrahydrodipicolinate synthase [Chitinivibrionia bacterium]|nr:4-hydroxy-tetrahydrodipicolinate synthase [Chitinivibrionia bacterium]
MNTFAGTYTALVTPFSDGRVDMDAFRGLLKKQKLAGVTGVVPCGCTGEAATLSVDERTALIGAALEISGGGMTIIAGTGTNSTASTIELTKQSERLGTDAAMLITPYYNKPTQEGLYRHFMSVAEAVCLPLILYNVPGRTGTKIEPLTVKRLFDTGRFAAIKEAGGSVDAVSDLLSLGSVRVLSGDDSLTLPMISLGAAGVISVVSNIFPKAVCAMVSSACAGDFDAARTIHYKLLPVIRAAFIETNPGPIKAMLAYKGMIEESFRLPLVPVSDGSRESIRKTIDRFAASWSE